MINGNINKPVGERSFQSSEPTKLMLENRTRAVEPSLLQWGWALWGLVCCQNILVKTFLAIRGHQITSKSAFASMRPGFVSDLCRAWALNYTTTIQTILQSYLLRLSVPHYIATVLAPNPTSVTGKFSELSDFRMEDVQPPACQGQHRENLIPVHFFPCQAYSLWGWKLHCANSNKLVRFEGHDRECHLLKDKEAEKYGSRWSTAVRTLPHCYYP